MFYRGLPTHRLFVITLLLGLLSGVAQAAYRYQDGTGNTCYTDDWRTIPVEFRASADPPVPNPPPIAAPSTPGGQVTSPTPQGQPAIMSVTTPTSTVPPPQSLPAELWERPMVRIGAYAVAAIAAMVLLFKLVAYIPSPMIGRLILLAVFLGVVTYGYKLYVESMVDGYFAVKKKTTDMMNKSMKREATPLPDGLSGTPQPTPADQ